MSAPLPSSGAVAWADPARRAAFESWLSPLAHTRGLRPGSLRPASADASFRRYLRIDGADDTFIVMDAPPPQEDVRPFVHIAGLIQGAGLHAPQVLECDPAQGFLLLTDLGTTLYLDQLREATPAQADRLMRDAVKALVQFQQAVDPATLPPTTRRSCSASSTCFPTGASSASTG